MTSLRRHMGLCLVTVLLCWALPAFGQEDEGPVGLVLVDIRPEAGVDGWVADALEQNIIREIFAYQHIRVMDKLELDTSACEDLDCRLGLYAGAGIDIAMVGWARADRLSYQIYECWTPARVRSGSFGLGSDVTMARLKQRILGAATPFLKKGGLLDEKPVMGQGLLLPNDQASDAPSDWILGILFALVALFFAIPPLLAMLGTGRRQRLRSRRWYRPVLMVAVVLAIECGTGALGRLWAWLNPQAPAAGIVQSLEQQLGSWEWVLAITGGVAWGALLLLTLKTAFPPIGGMDRIAHQEVLRLLKAWLVVCGQRMVLLAVCYLPFGLMFWWISGWYPGAQRLALILVAPFAGLLLRAWFLALVESCGFYLDDRLVAGDASPANPWHRYLHRYFEGYLNRTGLAVEQKLLDRVLFLPGKTDKVLCYGGGISHPRILIPTKLLQSAVGVPEEAQPESSFVPWSDGLKGFVFQNQNNPPPARSTGMAGMLISLGRLLAAPLRLLRSRLPKRSRASTGKPSRRKMLGRAATSLGYAVPFPPEELVPLIADGDEDFEIVRQLLSEHYAWFEADPDDVSDDTDPTDRDFLFGLLVREIGQIQRQESQLDTLLQSIELRFASRGAWVEKPVRAAVDLHRRLLSRAPALLADGYAALNLARNHLVQYLYYAGFAQDDLLSARADGPELQAISNEIFARVRAQESGSLDRQRRRATVRNRLVWLSQFFDTGLSMPRRRWAGIMAYALVSLSVLAGSFFLFKQAADYHATYVQRMAEQEQKIEESKRESARDNKGYPEHGQKG